VEPPRTVAEVLERVHTTWAALHEAIAGLSDQQLTQPGPEGWSVKDHLAHIMVWDSVPIAVLRGEPQHRAFGLDRDAYDRIDSVDQLNAIIYEQFKGVPLAEVRTGLDSVRMVSSSRRSSGSATPISTVPSATMGAMRTTGARCARSSRATRTAITPSTAAGYAICAPLSSKSFNRRTCAWSSRCGHSAYGSKWSGRIPAARAPITS
jgi:hypothetical protein